jgi:NifB/MoaA-like Fe-S oxidoreductase
MKKLFMVLSLAFAGLTNANAQSNELYINYSPVTLTTKASVPGARNDLSVSGFPEEERYDGYIQLENGVGMMRLLINEFDDAVERIKERYGDEVKSFSQEISLATGRLVYPCIKELAEKVTEISPGIKIHVYEIINEFFGERITVSGLLTGQDIIKQLTGKELGERLYLPENLLRSGEDYLLDDVTIGDISKALSVDVGISKCDGYYLACALFGVEPE